MAKPEEIMSDAEYLRHCLARHCWKNARTAAPSGTPWPDVFHKMHGITLREYEALFRREYKPRLA